MTGPELGTRPMPLFPQLGAGRIDGVALGITATREQSVDMVSRDSRERGVPSGHPDTRRRCGAPFQPLGWATKSVRRLSAVNLGTTG